MTTHIICVVDRSASMESIKHGAIGGYNQFLHDQQECASDTAFTTILFNERVSELCINVPAAYAPELNAANYVPSGWTALRDALGYAINDVGRRIPSFDSVIVCVITDGEENRSRIYSGAAIRELVDAHTAKGWTFIYLAANIDAFATGEKYGFASSTTYAFHATAAGAAAAYADMSRAATAARMCP